MVDAVNDLAIHLLGRPRVERRGVAVAAPRGHKAWGVLAYLLLADRPPSRDELASLLFAEADDPQAALRWNLSALRRLLGDVQLNGDPLALRLPAGTFVDVREPDAGGVGRELLQGMYFSSSPGFEIWLATERRHLAADLAARLVQCDPLDEGHQVLLIRSLATAGDGIGAARQAARCTELFRRELGVDPSPAVAEAVRTVTDAPTAGPVGGRAAARAQLEAGDAAIAAGALDAGLQCLRRAVADARSARDAELEARSLLALGSALVRTSRGRDEEAATALHETLAVAERHGLDSPAAAAARELGYVEFLQARYERAEAWLARALRLAVADPAERGRIGSVLGAVRSDTAHYARAAATLGEA
jgi:DNA-binding SARP family transcriptional activator